MHIAVTQGHTDLALSLLTQSLLKHGVSVNQENRNGDLPLHLATANGHTELVQSLIKHGASVNQADRDGNLPLHIAVTHGHTEVVPSLSAQSLLKRGTSVNQENRNGDLPLHLAAANGHPELVQSLIKHGASVNKKDGGGNLPLHIAVRHGHTELALSLINQGALVNQENRDGYLPIRYYIRADTSVKLIDDELFMRLMPRANMDIMKIICTLVEALHSDVEKVCGREVLSRMLQLLIQHMILVEPLSMSIEIENFVDFSIGIRVHMQLNENKVTGNMESFKAVYLSSVLLIRLESDVSHPANLVAQLSPFASAEDEYHARAIDDIWTAYKEKQKTVKKLQTLCIQKTRQSMHSLSDESFQSLQVTHVVCQLLMLRDVADVLFEAYQMWPKCMPIEEII